MVSWNDAYPWLIFSVVIGPWSGFLDIAWREPLTP
jgi:hypothetical protein